MKPTYRICVSLIAQLWVGASQAVIVLDQTQWYYGGAAGVYLPTDEADLAWAQVFEAGVTGTLSHISIQVACKAGAGPLEMSIHTVGSDGKPAGMPLATVSRAADSMPGYGTRPLAYHAFPFSGSRVAMTAGSRYAFTVRAPEADCEIGYTVGDNYPPGQPLKDTTSAPDWDPFTLVEGDLEFRTYVDDGTFSSSALCRVGSFGEVVDWLPSWTPACACLRDPTSALHRCRFDLPELVIFREIPLFDTAGKTNFSVMPFVEFPGPVHVQQFDLAGNGFFESVTFEDAMPPMESTQAAGWFEAEALEQVRIKITVEERSYEFDVYSD